MTKRILVTGGTGTLGRLVVPLLVEAGAKVRVLSRHEHAPRDGIEFATGDLLQCQGVEAAVDGVEIVVHLAGGPKGDEVATANLMRAAAAAGVEHVVLISVVGADRVPIGYFRSKLGAEQAVRDSGIPWTILRATQFHDLMLKVARALAKLPVIPVASGVSFQPVEAGEVAARITELALGTPLGLVDDLAGPRTYQMKGLIRGYLQTAGHRRVVIPIPLPGKGMRALRAGANLAPEHAVGRRTWPEFLAGHSD